MTLLDAPTIPRTRRPIPPAIPPLQNGDNLTRAEFERRYDAMPPGTKAELIEGIVYMSAAALSHEFHSEPHFDLIALLGTYKFATPGVVGGDNGTCYLDDPNMPQPDIYLMVRRGLRGSATVNADGYVVGPPEFVLEVANTSADYDLHQKFRVYQRNGVREYAVWRTLDADVDFFRLRDGTYVRVEPDAAGVIRSEAMPGLWLNVIALLHGEMELVVADVQRGLASPEHAAFAAELKRRMAEAGQPAVIPRPSRRTGP